MYLLLQSAVDNSVWSSQSILLVAEGLDTIATVYINEIKIGRSENMFVRNTFDVKSAVKVNITRF